MGRFPGGLWGPLPLTPLQVKQMEKSPTWVSKFPDRAFQESSETGPNLVTDSAGDLELVIPGEQPAGLGLSPALLWDHLPWPR